MGAPWHIEAKKSVPICGPDFRTRSVTNAWETLRRAPWPGQMGDLSPCAFYSPSILWPPGL